MEFASNCNCNLMVYGAIGLVLYLFVTKVVPIILRKRTLNRWKNTPKNTVIFHGVPRPRKVPQGSPFTFKLETFLKAANIPYEFDCVDPLGPTGKTPWISYHGEHIGDSHLAIQYLKKKFDINLNAGHSEDKLAIAHAARIILEEHVFFGIRLWAFIGDGRKSFAEHVNMPWIKRQLVVRGYGRIIKQQTWAQGLGRHSDADIQEKMFKDLRAISKMLGNKKFFIGDQICEDDCAIFGFLALLVWGHGSVSPYGKLVKEELPNLIGYCDRVKTKLWPDWDRCLNP